MMFTVVRTRTGEKTHGAEGESILTFCGSRLPGFAITRALEGHKVTCERCREIAPAAVALAEAEAEKMGKMTHTG